MAQTSTIESRMEMPRSIFLKRGFCTRTKDALLKQSQRHVEDEGDDHPDEEWSQEPHDVADEADDAVPC